MENDLLLDDYKEHYNFLEELRKSGKTNMYAAMPYLQAAFNMRKEDASFVLKTWMSNYSELAKRFGW